MSQLGDFLKKKIKDKMEFHKRSASGESVETLREEIRDGHLLIYGVDYWDNINNGVQAGTLVPLTDIQKWVSNKQSRYGGVFPAASAIQRKLFAQGSSTDEADLQIIPKVVNDNKAEITRQAESLVVNLLKLK
tara:strand:+ start:30 stop:428 length:399 start_codon:yes stop_codon:yes gene_type:complete